MFTIKPWIVICKFKSNKHTMDPPPSSSNSKPVIAQVDEGVSDQDVIDTNSDEVKPQTEYPQQPNSNQTGQAH